jgi:hypothetical protein
MKSKSILIAPFWGNPQHVGARRVERFVRWLSAEGMDVVIVRAGHTDRVRNIKYGWEITVHDPLGLYGDVDTVNSQAYHIPKRNPDPLRRRIAYMLFNPDPTAVWAWRVCNHALVLKHGQNARWVISSSPPESVHLAGNGVATKLKASHVVDMRDGWLDKPLRPILNKSRIRRWREGRLERGILKQASHIFSATPTLKQLLNVRLPFTENKSSLLTNGCSPGVDNLPPPQPAGERIRLLYAGRFIGSRHTQKVEYLFGPLFLGIEKCQGEVLIYGRMESEDLKVVEVLKTNMATKNWQVNVNLPILHKELLDLYQQIDGLLLLAAEHYVLTSKLFEYLSTGKPILCATLSESDAWKICEDIPQMFCVDYTDPDLVPVRAFLRACMTGEYRAIVPEYFTDTHLAQVFMEALLTSGEHFRKGG